MGGWVSVYEYIPKKGVPSSGMVGWVDPTWDKVLNSTVFFLRYPMSIHFVFIFLFCNHFSILCNSTTIYRDL